MVFPKKTASRSGACEEVTTGMRTLRDFFERNRRWAEKVKETDPDFFMNLSRQQKPEYLWIGCSDSRVPANEIVDMLPGTIFVHRNIANLVIDTDLNCLSVVQYAVEILRVRHIIVCGHYGCGGVQAAMEDREHGLMDSWLQNIRDVYSRHRERVDAVEDERARIDLMCELNVIEQAANLCRTAIVRSAWQSGRELAVHGWIYGIEDGILRDLDVCFTNLDEMYKRMG